VSGREHEPIAVGPIRVARVEFERAIPERVRHRRGAHGQSGVAGIRLLDHVDREEAQRIDAQLIERRRREDRRKGHAGYASAGRADGNAVARAGRFRIDLMGGASWLRA